MLSSIMTKAALAACLLVAAASQARPVEYSVVELTPCTVHLVDGTEVVGNLAPVNMDDHLIVYSPRLATVRSFMKGHAHALSVDGQRKQLNPKRELTAQDRHLLGRVAWPDAPREKARQPAYATETWQAPRKLMVWARPGQSGMRTAADNWLIAEAGGEIAPDAQSVEDGMLKDSWWHADTDIVVPAAVAFATRRGAEPLRSPNKARLSS